MTVDEYKNIIKERLSEKRYHHCVCVAKEAVRLAKKYGADEKKAEIAGILHDITKETELCEQLEIIQNSGYVMSKLQLNASKLWHSISGSIYVKEYLDIDDEDIINAIRFHTTGRKNMSLLEKVIFLADFTSEERDYSDVDVIREKANSSLEEGMIYGLSYTINKLAKTSVPISEDSIAVYNQLLLNGDIIWNH